MRLQLGAQLQSEYPIATSITLQIIRETYPPSSRRSVRPAALARAAAIRGTADLGLRLEGLAAPTTASLPRVLAVPTHSSRSRSQVSQHQSCPSIDSIRKGCVLRQQGPLRLACPTPARSRQRHEVHERPTSSSQLMPLVSAQRGKDAVDHHAGLAEVVGGIAQPGQRGTVEMLVDLRVLGEQVEQRALLLAPPRGRCRTRGRARTRGRCTGPGPSSRPRSSPGRGEVDVAAHRLRRRPPALRARSATASARRPSGRTPRAARSTRSPTGRSSARGRRPSRPSARRRAGAPPRSPRGCSSYEIGLRFCGIVLLEPRPCANGS